VEQGENHQQTHGTGPESNQGHIDGERSHHCAIPALQNGTFTTFHQVPPFHLNFLISSRQGSVIADFSVSLLHRYYHGITRLQDAINMEGKIEETLPVSLKNFTSTDGKPYFLSVIGWLFPQDNSPFPSCFQPLCQSQAWCTTIHMKMSLICVRMKSPFHTKGWALRLALRKRLKVFRK